MLQPSTFHFLEQLARNNHTAWFHENRLEYEIAKKNFEEFVDAFMKKLGKIEYLGFTMPKECIFRINRDIRFTTDKRPYKMNFAAAIAKGGKKSPNQHYYFHLQPGGSFIGGGLYRPDSKQLGLVRDFIAKRSEKFLEVIDEKNFLRYFGGLQGDKLKNPPRGFSKEHPHIELLKMKGFVALHHFSDEEVLHEDFMKQAMKVCVSLKPYLDLLNRILL